MVPAGITLRPARADEADALGNLGYAAWDAGTLGQLDAGRVDRVALRAEFISLCRKESAWIMVASAGAGPLGWGAREDHDDYISDLWVLPQAQGRGIGTALLGQLESDIASVGYDAARLSTHAGNLGAIRLYERIGYRVTARGREYSSSLGYEIDKVRLAKPLKAVAGTGTRERSE